MGFMFLIMGFGCLSVILVLFVSRRLEDAGTKMNHDTEFNLANMQSPDMAIAYFIVVFGVQIRSPLMFIWTFERV